MYLVQVQQFGTVTRYGLQILDQFGKRVKSKSLIFWGGNSYVPEVTEEKLVGGCLFALPILNRINET